MLSGRLGNRWFVLPAVSFQALASVVLLAGLPEMPFAQLYIPAVFLASVAFRLLGAVASSLTSTAFLAAFGYLFRGLPLPELPYLLSQLGIYVVLGLLTANIRYDAMRYSVMIESLREKNAGLLAMIDKLTAENSQLVEENAALKTMRDRTMQFVGSVAHDLRAPIAAVKGNAQVLLRTGKRLNAEKQLEMLQGIVYAGNQLQNAVDNLLDASLIEAGRFALDKQEVSVSSLVGDCVRMMAGSIGEHTIELAIEKDLPTVHADPENVAQVLVNLLTNAIKYSPPKSKVQVRVERRGDYVAISVKDEGMGIAERDLEHIFERYFRSEDVQSRQIRGTGLGLSISRDIVLAHGGELTVQSKVNVGSTFTFTLPIFKTAKAAEGDNAGGSAYAGQVA